MKPVLLILLLAAGCSTAPQYAPLPPAQPVSANIPILEAKVRTAIAPAAMTAGPAAIPAPPPPAGAVTVLWGAPCDTNGVPVVDGLVDYLLMWGTNSLTYRWQAAVPYPGSQLTISNLPPGQICYLTIIGRYNNGATSAPSGEIQTPVVIGMTNFIAPSAAFQFTRTTVNLQSSPDLLTWTNCPSTVTLTAPSQYFRVEFINQ